MHWDQELAPSGALGSHQLATWIARNVTGARITTVQLFHLVALHEPSLPRTAWAHQPWIVLAFFLAALLLGWLICRVLAKRLEGLRDLRFRDQVAERTRVARDLNDTLLQTIEASKMIADDALDRPADPVSMRRTMRRLSEWLGRATEEGRQALDSLQPIHFESGNRTASPFFARMRKLSRQLRVRRKKRRVFRTRDG